MPNDSDRDPADAGASLVPRGPAKPTSPQRAAKDPPPPSRKELLAAFGPGDLSIPSLFQFCFVPPGRLALLSELATAEDWGDKDYVLLRYLAVHIRLALEQDRYVWNGEQIVMSAGTLSNGSGAPLYLGLVPNSTGGENPWVLNWVGERPSTAELPGPAEIGEWPDLDPGSEILVAADLADPDRRVRPSALEGVEPITQVCALIGAVHWALHRGLAVPQLHGGGRGFFAPVYLTTRDDLTAAPDAVVPLVPQGGRYVIRTVLDPASVYPPSRCVVERGDQLPAWLLESWDASRETEGSGS